jgi:nitrogen regulatory protein P-II 1
MKMIIAIVRPKKLQDIQTLLVTVGIERFTVENVMGCGNQFGYVEVNLLKKIRFEIEIPAENVKDLVKEILDLCRTPRPGDGKIFVMNIPECYDM